VFTISFAYPSSATALINNDIEERNQGRVWIVSSIMWYNLLLLVDVVVEML
jgi:hypothetical protein